MSINNSTLSPALISQDARPRSASMEKTTYVSRSRLLAAESVQPLIDETALILNPATPLYNSTPNFDADEHTQRLKTGQMPTTYQSQALTCKSDWDGHSSVFAPHLSRARSLPEELDNYFRTDDHYDDDDDIDIPEHTFQDYTTLTFQWQFRHTISYWISTLSIFGCLCFTVGSVFLVFSDSVSARDEYTLCTYMYFIGSFSFLISSYFAYYDVISERKTKNYHCQAQDNTFWYNYIAFKGKKTYHFWITLILLLGTVWYHVAVTAEVLKYEFVPYSFNWYVFKFGPLWIGGLLFFVSGLLQMVLNKFWLWRPYKLSWWASYGNGCGGFFFFLGGFGVFYEPQPSYALVVLYVLKWPYLIGSIVYFLNGILYLYMWKLQQFGLCFLPHLNKPKSFKKQAPNIVLNRDIFFIVFYNFSLCIAFVGVCYCFECKTLEYWMKGFFEKIIASFGILAIGSFIHREPERPPFNYLVWFIRFFFVIQTINGLFDTLQVRSCVVNDIL